jgi:hypothetical protein
MSLTGGEDHFQTLPIGIDTYWHQGSIGSFRILYQDADGLGGEVTWEGKKAEIIASR